MQHHFEKAKNIARSIVQSILFEDKNHQKGVAEARSLEEKEWTMREKLFDSKSLVEDLQLWNTQNKEAEVERFSHAIKTRKKELKITSRGRKVRRLLTLLRYVAVVTLIFGASYFIYTHYQLEDLPTNKAISGYSENRANLILSSGERIIIKSNETIDLSKSSRLIVETTEDTEKIKVSAESVETTVEFHTIETPKGGGYTLELADGSLVKLNADSRLRFPSSFVGKQREVYLDGEAYFEIAHNKEQPFIVRTGGMDVEVLGTKFNIKAHSGDENTYATLASGSVKVFSPKQDELLLMPSEQAVFTNTGEFIQKRNVNLSSVLGWTEGRFVFKDESLENILKQLSRWYSVKIDYKDIALKEHRFTGDINRFEDISVILNMLNKTYTIQLFLEQDSIVVVENNNSENKL